MRIVDRSEGSDLRHVNLNTIGHVGGRYPRSDLQLLTFYNHGCDKKLPKNLKTK